MNPASSFPHGGPSQGITSRLLGMLSRHKCDNDALEWTATIFTTAEIAKGRHELDFLDLNLVGEHGCIDAEKEGQNLATWKRATWTSLDNRDIGFFYTGKIRIPNAIGTPQVAVFWNTGGKGNPDSFLVSRLVLTPPPNAGLQPITFAVNSNIHHKQGPRIFFDDKPRLPSQTSKLLEQYREAELAELRGGEPLSNPTEWDRVYQFDYFNDLGVPSDKESIRPVLGGLMYKGDVFDENGYPNTPEVSSGGKLGFPRRLRTGRGHYGDTPYENAPGEHEDFWLPLDEKFDALKQANFDKTKKLYQLSLLNGLIAELAASHTGILKGIMAAKKPDATPFPDFKSVESLFTSPLATAVADIRTAVAQALGTLDRLKLEAVRFAFGVDSKEWEKFLKSTKPGHELHLTDGPAKVVNSFCELINNLPFQVPAVYKDRKHLWETDEEWGRETIAGTNPCVIQAIKSIPKESKVTAQDLKPHLGGHTLEDLLELEVPRLFMIDYSVVYPAYTKLINAKKHDDVPRYQYAGRAYLFLRDDNQLVPVAIELFTGEEPEAVLYTPSDPSNVWLLVKAVFASIDAGFHQLYSHFARTHACLESSLIAMRRQLSAMHPVYKLLMPHFRFMLGINKNGRQTNINSGGFIEKVFTPGKFALTMAAEVYTAVWKFEDQSLPNDLISRKMARKGKDGKVELLLQDYPYASDGLLVWNSVEKWVSEYLSLYYTGGEGATVTSDNELMAWWEDYRLKGHPDKKEGWPKLESVEDLTQIITTIIWLASAHHAAVNFAQYDYSGYMPNRSTIVHRPIPAKGTEEYEDLVRNLDRTFFNTLAKPMEALLNLTAMAVLSTHSENEQYISDREHFYIFDPKARELYDEHIDEITKVEKEIENRNNDPDSTTRSRSKGGLPYMALTPSSDPGITGRGIPNSITI